MHFWVSLGKCQTIELLYSKNRNITLAYRQSKQKEPYVFSNPVIFLLTVALNFADIKNKIISRN